MKWTLRGFTLTASAAESTRPMLTDAPEWFNRARARNNRKQSFLPQVYKPQPVPLPSRATPGGLPSRGFWRRHRSKLLGALSVVALPIVFALGFWSRGMVVPTDRKAVDIAAMDETPAAVVLKRPAPRVAEARAALAAAQPAADSSVENLPQDHQEIIAAETPSAPEVARRRPRPATVAQRENGPSAWGIAPIANTSPEPGDGFILKTAGNVRQVSAEVIRPAKAWFETAATDVACASGACPAPVARLDRKLNTGLEWSASPAAAAELAQREGKLVFLIHVSGNFALPGFT